MLSPRAGVALLTLQLRAALQEAAAAEAEDAGWDLDESISHIRSRLAPRVEDRRRALDEEMTHERVAATDALARARADAAAIVANAQAAADADHDRREQQEALAAAALVVHEVADDDVANEGADVAVDIAVEGAEVASDGAEQADSAPQTEPPGQFDEPPLVDRPTGADQAEATQPVDASTVETLARLTALRNLVDELMRATATGAALPSLVPSPPESASVKVVIDADSFGKAFSTAIATMMDERLAMHRAQQEAWMTAPWRVVPAAAPPPKKSFWANAWHADVLLSVIAMIIVLVVLVAWST